MTNFTSNTYTLKRKILTFTNKISKRLTKPERKFTADITYGILASGSCLLTDVVDQLHENSQKINIVDRLSRHLEKGTPAEAATSYLQQIRKWVSSDLVIHIDDSDVVKPDGYKFEALGIVRDGSESTSTKNVYKKGYHVTVLQKLVSSLPAIIQLVSFHESIPLLKRTTNLQIQSPLMPWNKGQHSLEKPPLQWIVVMMIIKCFSKWMN